MMKEYSKERYFNLNEDVILVEGACGGLIQDLKREKLYSIDAMSKKCLKELIGGKNIYQVSNELEDVKKIELLNYLGQLVDKELGFFSYMWINNKNFEKCIYKNIDTIWLELRKACNLKCCHCYMDSNCNSDNNLELLNLKQWKQVILQAKEYNPKRIILIGGEPLLFKDINLLIEFIRNHMNEVQIVLYSNLTLINNELIQGIIRNNVKVITSIYSTTSEIHDRITGIAGSFKRTVEGVKRLRKHGVYVQANTVIMNENFQEAESMPEFLYELTNIRGKLDVVRNVGKEKSELIPRGAMLDCSLMKIKPSFKGISKEQFIKNYSGNSCWQGKINIGCDGYVSPCIMGQKFINKGFNIKNHSFEFIIEEYLKKEIWCLSKDYIYICCDCEYRYVCKDCRPIAVEGVNFRARGQVCKYNPYEREWTK